MVAADARSTRRVRSPIRHAPASVWASPCVRPGVATLTDRDCEGRMSRKSGETIDVARIVSTGQDRKTNAIVRIRAEDGRVIARVSAPASSVPLTSAQVATPAAAEC